MTTKGYLIGLILVTVLSLGSFIAVGSSIDPADSSSLPVFILFYLTLFLGAAGLFGIIGYFFRRRFQKNKVEINILSVSFRQGILLASLLILSLIFQKHGWLIWWSGVALVLSVVAVEAMFLSRRNLNS